MPSHLLQSGASASRFPQSPARPPEECAASLAWQTFKGAHKGAVMKTLWSTGVGGAGGVVGGRTGEFHLQLGLHILRTGARATECMPVSTHGS